MNTNLIKKCLQELSKDKPDISYIRGVLESIVEMGGSSLTTSTPSYALPPMPSLTSYTTSTISEVEDVPGFLKTGPTGKITNE